MAIESEVEVLKAVVSKLDASIEKISQVSSDIGRLLAVHEQRIDQLERTDERRMDDIKELHSRITTGNREIMDKLDEKIDALAKADKEQHEALKKSMDDVKGRVDVLERWRWMIVGGAVVIGYMMSHLSVVSKIFG
jgi:chromosome segregation ATPase